MHSNLCIFSSRSNLRPCFHQLQKTGRVLSPTVDRLFPVLWQLWLSQWKNGSMFCLYQRSWYFMVLFRVGNLGYISLQCLCRALSNKQWRVQNIIVFNTLGLQHPCHRIKIPADLRSRIGQQFRILSFGNLHKLWNKPQSCSFVGWHDKLILEIEKFMGDELG